MSPSPAYVPCQCPKCRQRPVYGVCRCTVCRGMTPQEIRAAQDERRTALAKARAVELLRAEDLRALTDKEVRELEQALSYLTRS